MGPRNRGERRKAARLERRLLSAGAPQVPARTPEQDAPKAQKNTRSVEERYLEQWCAERGPLFESARVAVCRALALGAATRVLKGAPDWALKERASRVLGEALRPVAPSNNPASGEQWARSRKLLTEINTLLHGGAGPGRFVAALVAAFERDHCAQHPEADAEGEYLEHYAWANLVAALYFAPDGALRLRAARTLLAWTRDEARKVGRERRRPVSPEVMELLEELRDALAGLRACFPLPLGEGARRAGEGCVVAARVCANAPPQPSLPTSPRLRRTRRSPSATRRGEKPYARHPGPVRPAPARGRIGSRGCGTCSRRSPLPAGEGEARRKPCLGEGEKLVFVDFSLSPTLSRRERGAGEAGAHPEKQRPRRKNHGNGKFTWAGTARAAKNTEMGNAPLPNASGRAARARK